MLWERVPSNLREFVINSPPARVEGRFWGTLAYVVSAESGESGGSGGEFRDVVF